MSTRPVLFVVVLWGQSGFPQATDFIDTRDLAGRAVSFEGQPGVASGLREVRTIGDVNGDGLSDIGLAHVRELGPDLDISFHAVLGSPGWAERNPITPDLEPSARFWPDVTRMGRLWIGNVGDLNEDGFAEFSFTATGYRLPGAEEGVFDFIFIVYGEPGFEYYDVELSEIAHGLVPGTMVYDSSSTEDTTGRGGAITIDLNSDGRRDLVTAGIHRTDVGTSGTLYVLTDPRDLGPRVDLKDLGKTIPGFTLRHAGLAETFADAGDFDGDGFHDLIIDSNPGSGQGSFFLFYGRADLEGTYSLAALSADGSGAQRFLPPRTPEDTESLSFGGGSSAAAGVGDINGDGFGDILIGEPYVGWTGAHGRVYLIYGGPRWQGPLPVDELPPGRRTVFHGLARGDSSDLFGSRMGAPGDINGDGIPDLLMSAFRSEDDVGEVYLVYGRADFPSDLYLSDGFDGILVAGAHANGALGNSLDSAGDFNGDGNPDFLVGEPQISSSATGGSRTIVVFGTGNGIPPLHAGSLEPRSGFQRGGTRVTIRGTGFAEGAQVRFGGSAARVLEVSATAIVVELPQASAPGDVAVTVSLAGRTVTARERFEYVPDRPEVDLLDPGRWGLRVDDLPGTVLGLSLDFADIDADGADDLLIGSDLVTDWVVTVVRGGRALPETMEAFTPGAGKSHIFKRGTESRTYFEVRVRAVGDVNGDGIADLGVAAWLDSSYLFFGRRNLEAELDFDAEVEGGRAVRLLHDPSLIGHFAPVGDLTGDGIDDFAMSLSFDSILFIEGRREWPAELDLFDDDEGSIFSRLSRQGAPRFAVTFAAAGDVNADGHLDLLVSGGESATSKKAYLVYTREAAELPVQSGIEDYIELGGGVLFEWEARPSSFTNLVINVAGVGDVNGDGIDDFVLGDEEGTVGESHQGVTYLIHGRRDFPARVTFPYAMGSPIEMEGVVRLGTQDVDQAGRCVGPAGDYNGDGHPDFLVGSQGQATIDFEMPGRMHVVFGSPALPPAVDLGDLGRHGFRLEGIRRSTWMTVASWTPGDLNDDGALDFAFAEVSSPFWLLEDGVTVPPASVHVVYGIPPSVPFIRGDADGDGRLNITDGVFTLSHLFLGGVDPLCEDATDADDRGTVELTDAVYLLNHLFLGGSEPPPPYPTPGDDPTADQLGCRGF